MPCFNMPSLRRVSKERPGVLSNRAASFASRTDISVPSAPTRAATPTRILCIVWVVPQRSVITDETESEMPHAVGRRGLGEHLNKAALRKAHMGSGRIDVFVEDGKTTRMKKRH